MKTIEFTNQEIALLKEIIRDDLNAHHDANKVLFKLSSEHVKSLMLLRIELRINLQNKIDA